jgi:hypothetical protein
MRRPVLRACFRVFIALAMLAAYPIGLAMAAPMADMPAAQMDAAVAPHDCDMCEKGNPAPAKVSCIQNFCAAPCIVTEPEPLAAASRPVPLSGQFAKLHEWRVKPPVSPA